MVNLNSLQPEDAGTVRIRSRAGHARPTIVREIDCDRCCIGYDHKALKHTMVEVRGHMRRVKLCGQCRRAISMGAEY